MGWAASRVRKQGHGCLTSEWWVVFTGAGGLAEDVLPTCSCSALPQQLGWGRTRPRGWDTNISEPLCTLRGCLWSSPQCTDVWLFVCATTWIKNLRYSYSKNSFQDKQHPMYRTLEHTHTFICIRLWSLTLSLKGKLLFHPCFIDEATKIRKTCSKLIQLRALN